MKSERGKYLGPLSIVVAVIGLGMTVAIGAATFFGGTKIRPLFGMTANGPPRNAEENDTLAAPESDAGVAQVPDAGAPATAATP